MFYYFVHVSLIAKCLAEQMFTIFFSLIGDSQSDLRQHPRGARRHERGVRALGPDEAQARGQVLQLLGGEGTRLHPERVLRGRVARKSGQGIQEDGTEVSRGRTQENLASHCQRITVSYFY